MAKNKAVSTIKQRLRAGKLTASDVRKLESMVKKASEAAKALRAAVVE
jgi:hypothetical protein